MRVRIWRKLKRLGALPRFESNWVLPARPRCEEMATWLAQEIVEAGGKSALWKCESLSIGLDESLESQFLDPVDPEYERLIAALDEKELMWKR